MLETNTAPYTFVKLGIYYFSRRCAGTKRAQIVVDHWLKKGNRKRLYQACKKTPPV